MPAKVYLEGTISNNGHIVIPLDSQTVLFIIRYCKMFSHIQPVLVNSKNAMDVSVMINYDNHLNHGNKNGLILEAQKETNDIFAGCELPTMPHCELPSVMRCCRLPVLYDPHINWVRSGLCGVVRHIVELADQESPECDYQALLGFRKGCLRACAEVSGWTHFCEIDLPKAVQQFRMLDLSNNTSTVLPAELIKVETFMRRPAKLHNILHVKRTVLCFLRKRFTQTPEDSPANLGAQTPDDSPANLAEKSIKEIIEQPLQMSHGVMKFTVSDSAIVPKPSTEIMNMTDHGDTMPNVHKLTISDPPSLAGVGEIVARLTVSDIELCHTYIEGADITLTDLNIFVSVYYFLEVLTEGDISSMWVMCPWLMRWYRHMTTLSDIQVVMVACNMTSCILDLNDNSPGDQHREGEVHTGCDRDNTGNEADIRCHGNFVTPQVPKVEDELEDDRELSRGYRSKHKAYKPDLAHILDTLKDVSVTGVQGDHPCRADVKLDWSSFPAAVHPIEGKLPPNRIARKCEQLENLVTAVVKMAHPGDVIVDFCSGGGHLGIALAYMLPGCHIYLVENKDDSLMRAKQRVDTLQLSNITFFQCNLDYFHGRFTIGVCLHACGVATDMVLQQCLRNNASFVVCPCCYGAVQNTHVISYPRSDHYRQLTIDYKDYVRLGHGADMTEVGIKLENQGKHCMNLVDTDRLLQAMECGYDVTLCSLAPPTCTPKNNLLIGHAPVNTV